MCKVFCVLINKNKITRTSSLLLLLEMKNRNCFFSTSHLYILLELSNRFCLTDSQVDFYVNPCCLEPRKFTKHDLEYLFILKICETIQKNVHEDLRANSFYVHLICFLFVCFVLFLYCRKLMKRDIRNCACL